METNPQQPIRLQTAAMDVFARDGYAGSSLRTIASAAGIRASSIYYHFAGKDELFLSLIPIALTEEALFAAAHFRETAAQPARDALFGYLRLMPRRQKESASARFVLAIKYFAPKIHSQVISEAFAGHLQRLSHLFAEVYLRSEKRALPADLFAESFLSCLESLEGELIYTNDSHFAARLKALEALLCLAFGENNAVI